MVDRRERWCRVLLGSVPVGDGGKALNDGVYTHAISQTYSLKATRVMSPLVLILVVILILSVVGGGLGYRRGNNVLAGGGGLVGLILIILLIMFLTGNL